GGEAHVHVYAFAGINEGELTSWHNRLFNPDAWSLSHSHSHFLPELGANVSVLEIVSNRGVKKRLIHWNQIGNYRGASRIQSKLRQTWFKLLDVSAPGVAVAVTLPATNHSSVEALDQSLAELANSIDNMVELRAND
ncbi:MAG: hypothetical protein R3309_13445, partial [Reinekea sp.]|nr:hypothetical protein [Reinekea sp.]